MVCERAPRSKNNQPESYQNLKLLSFLFFRKYDSHKIPRAVAKAAMMLKEARMMAEVLIDLAGENFSSLKNIRWLANWVWLKAFLDLLKLPCGMNPVLSSRDSNHPTPPATPVCGYGDIGLIRWAATRLAMAMKPW